MPVSLCRPCPAKSQSGWTLTKTLPCPSVLEPPDFAGLLASCRRLRKVSLDNNHWRLKTFDESTFLENLERKRRLSQYLGDGILDLGEPTALTQGDLDASTYEARKKQRYMDIANWDPVYPDEPVLWYNEHVQRYAPATTNWLQQPWLRDGAVQDRLDVLGVALYNPPNTTESALAVSPLDDGSICLWDVKGQHKRKGAIVAKSEPGILHISGPGTVGRSRKIDTGVVECISVDSQRGRAFVAVQGHLMEVDLETLRVVSDQPFEWSIAALSAASPDVPLTVGTSLGIHLYDYRARSNQTIGDDPLPHYAPLSQPHPLSVLHLPNAGDQSTMSDDIYVAGRFSNILHYDRRRIGNTAPVVGSLHSGARLSSLTCLPYSFSPLDTDLRRRGGLTAEQVELSKAKPGRTLIACGEYNGKGSLELYGLPATSGGNRGGREHNSCLKNRQNAAASKILSVVNHGTRIVFSDGHGTIKWFERDGTTEVRRHRIGHSESLHKGSIFSSMPGAGDSARKLLSTKLPDAHKRLNDDEVLFWTGEKLGLVNFSGRPGARPEDYEEKQIRSASEERRKQAEDRYIEDMRMALGRQADDVRLLQNVGLPL